MIRKNGSARPLQSSSVVLPRRSGAWGWIDGAWRKFHDDHDDACTNFTILAANAKEGNRNVNVRVDGDRVKEMYVW